MRIVDVANVALELVQRSLFGHAHATDPTNLPHLVQFPFKNVVYRNCTLHQIVLNGIQTNFYVVPTFSPSPSYRCAGNLSLRSTSGVHSRWTREREY